MDNQNQRYRTKSTLFPILFRTPELTTIKSTHLSLKFKLVSNKIKLIFAAITGVFIAF